MTNEEAIKAIKANYPSGGYEDLCKALDMAIKALSEERKGKWIITKRNGILCGVCHSGFRRMPTLEGKPMFNYCPLCGAKNEGSEEE